MPEDKYLSTVYIDKLKIITYRKEYSGDEYVVVTHLPTGIEFKCDEFHSLLENERKALKMLAREIKKV